MSLADKLETRHRESGGGDSDQQVAVATPPASSTVPESPPAPTEPSSSNGSTNGAQRPPKVALDKLPQLKSSAPTLGGVPVAPAAWPAAQAAAKQTTPPAAAPSAHPRSEPRLGSRGSAVTATMSVETQVPKSTLLEAVQSTARATNVQIEITKGVAGYTTFMLKGRQDAVERAKPLLSSRLAPRIKTTVRIPSGARSALIGARGSNLRRLSESTQCKIDLASRKTAWSLEMTDVNIEGTVDGVAEAQAEVLRLIDNTRTVTATRSIPPLLVRFLAAHADYGSSVLAQRGRIMLQGTYNEVVPSMEAVDDLINSWTAEYVLQPLDMVQTELLGTTLEDIALEQHGVIVTPQGELYGPADRLGDAAALVQAYLSALTNEQLDISQAHNRNEAHARVLTRYLAATNAAQQISEQYGVKITEPTQGACVYSIVGEEKAASQARKALVALVNTHSPNSMAVVRGIKTPVVRVRASEIAEGLQGKVKAVIGPSDELYLVFEDPGDDFAPTPEEVKLAVDEAAAEFREVVELSRKVVTKTVNLDEDKKYIASPQGEEAQALYDQVIGSRNDVHCDIEGTSAVISGLREPVNSAIAALPEIIALSRQYAVKASFTQEVQFDPTLLRNLIGRGGSQIQSYRDQYGVSVEADDNGRVIVQGIEPQAKAAAKAIAELQRRLRDEQTERLVVPAQYHVKLIGSKGKHVKRLSEKYDVTIKFPKRNGSSGTDEPEPAATPDADADAIIIRGPSKGVAAVKREFLDLVNYEKSQSYSETLHISSKLMPRIVGRQGIAINTIKHESGAQIDIAKEADENDNVTVVVTGEQKRVAQAVKLINNAVEELQDYTERTIDVDPQYHRLLTGPGNSTRRQIVADAGGEVDPFNPRTLMIPPSHAKSSTIKMSGSSKVVDAMVAIIEKIVDEEERRSRASATINIPPSQHRLIIGPQGRLKRSAESKYNVQITVPRSQESDVVSVRGEREEDVEAAVKYLQELASFEQATAHIPSPIWTPRLKRKVSDKFGVKADGKFSVSSPQEERPDSGFLLSPLEDAPQTQLKLSGKSQEDLYKATAFLTDLAKTSDTVGYLWLDGQQVRKAVGAGGQNVNSVRSSTNCVVEIPDEAQSGPVVIVGDKESVEEARKALLKFCT